MRAWLKNGEPKDKYSQRKEVMRTESWDTLMDEGGGIKRPKLKKGCHWNQLRSAARRDAREGIERGLTDKSLGG